MRLLLALVLALAAPSIASAQATLLTGLGGPLDFGTDSPPRADDDTMPTPLSLGLTFPGGIDLYGTHYNDVYVNINGSLTFGAGLLAFSPDPFPRPAGSVPMLAGWWANVDTRPVPSGMADANQVYYASTFEHFVVTWIDVGYFDQHLDRLNAFQIILRPPSAGVVGSADVEFRYHRCEWTTGDDPASGGTGGLGGMPAQAGFDQGDGVHAILLPGSGTASILDLCTVSGGSGGSGSFGITIGGPARCGNGFREPGEACDDGNREPHDFCDGFCTVTTPCFVALPDGGRHDPFDAAAGDAAVSECDRPDANLEDAAFVFPDAGPDAGTDGGRRPDAGTRFDAGTPMPDAGRRDVGPRTTDELDIVGGGCGCRAGTQGSGRGLGLLGLVLLGARRRRTIGR